MQRRLGLDLEVPDEFGHFLAGFTAGEAHFGASIAHRKDGYKQLRLKYMIVLRDDDMPALEYIRDTLSVGKIYLRKVREGSPNPRAVYEVYRPGDLYHIIVPFFEKYPIPPQFKKSRDFEIWKELVEIHYHQGGPQSLGKAPGGRTLGFAPLPESYWEKAEALIRELKDTRRYKG